MPAAALEATIAAERNTAQFAFACPYGSVLCKASRQENGEQGERRRLLLLLCISGS
jgi:hypothetical protein